MQRLFANISKKCYSSHKKSKKVKHENGFKYRHSRDLQRSGRKSELLFWVNLPKRINDLKFWNQMKPGRPSLIHIHPSRRVTAGWHLSWTNLQFPIFFKEIFKIIGFSLISARNWIWSKRIWRWNFQNLGNFYVTSYETIAS